MTTIRDTGFTVCQWIGSKNERCGHRPLAGRAYCEDHLWRVYQKGTALGRRKKDLKTVNSVRTWQTLMDEAVQELENEGYDFRLERWD